jgi:hypothetical protein
VSTPKQRTARGPRWTARLLGVVSITAILVGFQERPRRYWGSGGWRPNPEREGLPVASNGVTDRGFTFCRLLYRSVRREPLGHGWNTDYPGSDWNFVERLEELTTVRPAQWEDGWPGFAVVRPSQDELFQCPFLFASDVGSAGLSPEEAERLRAYLLKGGLLWVDDFWGTWAWESWARQIAEVLPEYPIVDVGPEHRMMETLYDVPAVPQVPSIQFWRRSGRRSTSEQGRDSATPHLRAIFDDDGRPLVIMTHNTDIADGWEREGEDDEFFYQFSPDAYALGINLVLYALSH